MLDAETDNPPADVVAAVASTGRVASPGSWRRLSGGRTNRLWRFSANGADLVCKLYAPGAATPLFPNDPSAEARALRALEGTGLAPALRATARCGDGEIVIYDYVAPVGPATQAATAAALARLHSLTPPDRLRMLPGSAGAVLAQGAGMLAEVDGSRARELCTLRPRDPDLEDAARVFLHGDPVPANVVAARHGICLIDWQCPALGDPTEDLALFLSPAMQSLYGGRPLAAEETETFLAAYGDGSRAARYRALAPAYHFRMAAFCLWKAQAGDAVYGAAADLEIACLDQGG